MQNPNNSETGPVTLDTRRKQTKKPNTALSLAILGLVATVGIATREQLPESLRTSVSNAGETETMPLTKEELERKEYMETSMNLQTVENAVKEFGTKKVENYDEIDKKNKYALVTYNLLVNVEGKRIKLSVVEWICKTCTTSIPADKKNPWGDTRKGELLAAHLHINNLTTKSLGYIKDLSHGIALWAGAEENFNREPDAYYRDPVLGGLGVVKNPKPDKNASLLRSKIEKYLKGVKPLIDAKKARERAAKRKKAAEKQRQLKDL